MASAWKTEFDAPEPEQDLALVAVEAPAEKEDSEYSQSSSSSDDESDIPAGPIDPDRCLIGGPGYQGGAAKSPVTFYVTAKDARGTRVHEGGAYVVVRVTPGTSARAAGAEVVMPEVRDAGDGSYTCTYAVAARGDYELSVEVNGAAMGGSPFPVFFSPPEPPSEKPAEAAPPPATDIAGISAGLAEAFQIDRNNLAKVQAAQAALLPPASLLAQQAQDAQVVFPADDSTCKRALLVGNLNPAVNTDQLKQLFGFCGTVTRCELVGSQQQLALVEYATPTEASAGLAMHGMTVVDRALVVELASAARDAAAAGPVNPYAALQMQQMHQVAMAQLQSQQLAAQVAAIRAQAKLQPSAASGGAPGGKVAALSAIAALSKRLTEAAGATVGRRERSASPAKVKRRREVSPTIRYRKDRSRSAPRRRSPSPPRRRAPPTPPRRRRTPSPPRRRRSPTPPRRGRRNPTPPRRRSRSRSRRDREDREQERARSARREDRNEDRRGDRKRGDRDRVDHDRSRERESERTAVREREDRGRRRDMDDGEYGRRQPDEDRGRDRDRQRERLREGERARERPQDLDRDRERGRR
ncbi:hypothetical protein WJX81_002189 [Elliptochloris bilobata]|uniref:RRM domain-containing protein n=1 Tax=Elliptochloris bilobata TaxID=381761 RepID=A0AAW1RUY9_9CHLO